MTNCCCHPTLNYSPTQARDEWGRWVSIAPVSVLVKKKPLASKTTGRYKSWIVLGIDEKSKDGGRVGTHFIRDLKTKRTVMAGYWMDRPEKGTSWESYSKDSLAKRAKDELDRQVKYGLDKTFRLNRWHPLRELTTNADPLRVDPTRTVMLRKKFIFAMTVRFNLFKKALYDLVVKQDALGLGQRTVFNANPEGHNQYWNPDEGIIREVNTTKWQHGSPHFFSKFGDPSIKKRLEDPGFYGTGHYFLPEGYKGVGEWSRGGFVYTAETKVKKPLVVEGISQFPARSIEEIRKSYPNLKKLTEKEAYTIAIDEATEKLRAQGYDSVYVKSPRGLREFVALDPEVVKITKRQSYREWLPEKEQKIIARRQQKKTKSYSAVKEKKRLQRRLEKPSYKREQINPLTGEVYNSVTLNVAASLTRNFGPWSFMSSERRMEEFKKWLRTQFSLMLLSKMSLFGEENDSDSWLREYINEGYQRGLTRAYDDWKRPTQTMRLDVAGQAYQQGGKAEFMRQSFGGPVSVSRVRLLASRAYDTLKGVTEQMAATISHVLSDGMVAGESPKDVGKKLNSVVDGYKNRGITIARTETVRAHNEGALTGLENLGATHVGVMVEWSTSKLGVTKKGNPSPCKLCAPLAKTVLTVEEARGLLPRHPNCMCSLIPANVGEDPARQKRKYEQITKAIQTSLDMERPKSKTALVKSGYSWAGATKRIAKSRPSLV